MDQALSGLDMALATGAKVITYDQLSQYKLEDLLPKCVLLYKTEKNRGHWCCIYENGNTITFFDSYGFIIDSQLNFVSPMLSKKLNGKHKRLLKMLYESKRPIEYNQYQLQGFSPHIQTCGRWVIVRLEYPSVSVDDFYKAFTKYGNPDETIVLLVPP